MGPYFTKGCALLWREMARRKLTQKRLADLLDTSDGQVNLWLYGKRGMSLKGALRVQKALDIDPSAFTKPLKTFRFPS